MLKEKISLPEGAPGPTQVGTLTGTQTSQSQGYRRGTAPPVDPFSGDRPDLSFEDWLPSLERAATWNGWTDDEMLLQLAGYLRGKARQEWNLMEEGERQNVAGAIETLKYRLDPRNRTLAAQDFRHIRQKEAEAVSDFIHRLEKTFQVAYGKDHISMETRHMLLYGQLQEGLKDSLMRSPAVSGAVGYPQLCLAAKSEEQHRTELARRQQYRQPTQGEPPEPLVPGKANVPKNPGKETSHQGPVPSGRQPGRRCYTCGSTGHLARDCRGGQVEGTGQVNGRGRGARTKQVLSSAPPPEPQVMATAEEIPEDPLTYLLSDSSSEAVWVVTVPDLGSQPKCAKVVVQGVPLYGIIDSGADITILGGKLFKRVAAVAKLRKRDFLKADQTPYTYNGKPFELDGYMRLEIAFTDKSINTKVYVKMDAKDQLLLSEGVCHQLGIISYHLSVEVWRGRKKPSSQPSSGAQAKVPSVRVQLVHAVRILPKQARLVQVKLDTPQRGPILFEPEGSETRESGYQAEVALLNPDETGHCCMTITNPSSTSQRLAAGTDLGEASSIDVVPLKMPSSPRVLQVSQDSLDKADGRKQKLKEILEANPISIAEVDRSVLIRVLLNYHHVFAIGEGERGETDLVKFIIDTGESKPIKQQARRIPFAVREEVSHQLKKMQESGVIQPSNSPWASPIVLVKKRDGTLRFCVDYRALNAVTRADTFPLPRIDDLLDQLGQAKYFSTLDLVAGYWQIQVHPDCQDKTAFITHRGLFEFRVMPFGLTNAPAAFQ